MRLRRTSTLAVVAFSLVAASPATPEAEASHCSTLQANLSGPAIAGEAPTGRADWRGTPACTGVELKVEVRDVNLPDGTVLTLDACGLEAGLTLNKGEARFELEQSVPICTRGSPITVRHAGTTVLSGTWCNPLFQRCD